MFANLTGKEVSCIDEIEEGATVRETFFDPGGVIVAWLWGYYSFIDNIILS